MVFLTFVSSKVNATDFFDTSAPSSFFNLSGRIGFNTSNRTFPGGYYNTWNKNSWGLGFNIGVLANLNFRDYLTIQPGIFYQSRSGNFAYVTDYLDGLNNNQTHYEMGHLRGYYINVPLMGIVKFNLSDKIKWSVEIGPYFQYCLKETGQNNVNIIYRNPQSNKYEVYDTSQKNYDAGIKVGTGLQFCGHYYLGLHYMAGFMDVWDFPVGGRNKSWEFSVGYDF